MWVLKNQFSPCLNYLAHLSGFLRKKRPNLFNYSLTQKRLHIMSYIIMNYDIKVSSLLECCVTIENFWIWGWKVYQIFWNVVLSWKYGWHKYHLSISLNIFNIFFECTYSCPSYLHTNNSFKNQSSFSIIAFLYVFWIFLWKIEVLVIIKFYKGHKYIYLHEWKKCGKATVYVLGQ